MTLSKRLIKPSRLLIFLPILLACSTTCSACQTALEKVNYFSLGWNGFAGKIGEGERLYLNILQKKEAREIFTSLFNSRSATSEAKLYAACGLWRLDAAYLNSLSGHQTHTYVSVLQGDRLDKKPFDEVLASIISYGCE